MSGLGSRVSTFHHLLHCLQFATFLHFAPHMLVATNLTGFVISFFPLNSFLLFVVFFSRNIEFNVRLLFHLESIFIEYCLFSQNWIHPTRNYVGQGMNVWIMKLHGLYFCHGATICKSISFNLSPKSFSPKHLNPLFFVPPTFVATSWYCVKFIDLDGFSFKSSWHQLH